MLDERQSQRGYDNVEVAQMEVLLLAHFILEYFHQGFEVVTTFGELLHQIVQHRVEISVANNNEERERKAQERK